MLLLACFQRNMGARAAAVKLCALLSVVHAFAPPPSTHVLLHKTRAVAGDARDAGPIDAEPLVLRSLRQVSKRSAALVVASATVGATRPTFIVSEVTANAVAAAAVFLAGVGAGAAISGPRAVAAAVGCQAAALVAARDAVAVSGAAAAAAGPLLATVARGDVALAAALSACLLPLAGVDVATYVLAPYAAGCVVNRTMSDSAFVAEAAPAAAAVALALVVGRCAASAATLCPRDLAALLAVPAVGAGIFCAAARVVKLPTAATRAVALAAPGLGGGALALAARCVVGAALASRWRAKDVDPGLTFESRVAERAAKLRASRAYVPDGLSVEEFARVRLKEEDYQKSLDLGAWGPRFKRTAAPGLFDKAWLQGVWYGRSQRPPRDDKPPKIGRAPKLKPRK